MYFTSATLLTLLATAAGYPLQARQSCSVDGALVCNGSSQFALCNAGTVVWQAVSDGTACVCDGDSCTINAIASGSSGSAAEPASATAGSSSATNTAALTAGVAGNGAGLNSFSLNLTPASTAAPATSTAASSDESTAAAAPASTTSSAIFSTTAAPSSTDTPVSSASSEPSSSASSSSSASGSSAYIKNFLGDGDVSQGWPAQSSWLDFDAMWDANLDSVISVSCTQFGKANNSPQESDDLKSAIQSVASSSGVDSRFILAITLQESNGCVRVPTTNFGVTNPGLMQSHDGSHSCADTNPCPSDEITGMIQDGTTGTSSGDGLQQLIAQTGASDVSKFYKAAVLYNSGSIPASGLLQDGTATPCYATDIANRLIGWSQGPSSCSL